MPSFLKVFRRRPAYKITTARRRWLQYHRPQYKDPRVIAFVKWCEHIGIALHPKIRIGYEGSCAEVGVVATDDIQQGERIAYIPRSALLTCANSTLLRRCLDGDDVIAEQLAGEVTSWVPLLLALIAEYGLENLGRWHPYLQLVPNNAGAGPPMLWSKSQRDTLLSGTPVAHWVQADLVSIANDFRDIVLPCMKRHPEVFKDHLCSQDLYERMVSFVMSYSFSDSEVADVFQRTMMVPFVDLLNHHSNHHVELAFMDNYLELVAIRPIRKGEEVMNTYGPLSNASLVHKYGFAELHNPHDVGYISSKVLGEVIMSHRNSVMQARWRKLIKDGLMEDEYCVSEEGSLDRKLLLTLKMLRGGRLNYTCLKPHLIKELQKDGASHTPGVSAIPPEDLELLRIVVERTLGDFSTPYESNLDESNLECAAEQVLLQRERYSLYLCLGQQSCLRALLEKCIVQPQ